MAATKRWRVSGEFLARRATWQPFAKECDASSAAAAREWALSQIGGCHGVRRARIRIGEVEEVAS
ncbi:MAG TPA: 50S ribosomal protein L18Ae [Thermoplasmata archaeon]|nr:50S ribosomal protein L18Ae [Thermoplasmata archaeon]